MLFAVNRTISEKGSVIIVWRKIKLRGLLSRRRQNL